jgi:hypothetical protein
MSEDTDFERARLLRASERYDKVIGAWCKFERGVKFITKEKRLDRAMPWFRRFLRARSGSEKIYDDALATLRTRGFASVQVDTLRAAFAKWKAEEKSRTAKINRAKRKKKAS